MQSSDVLNAAGTEETEESQSKPGDVQFAGVCEISNSLQAFKDDLVRLR